MKQKFFLLLALVAAFARPQAAQGCTGITLSAQDGAQVLARTIEWGGSYLNSRYVVVPRGYAQSSFLSGGGEGMRFVSRYGYVGLAVEQDGFVAEGLNEEGLSAGLFYFPGYGDYGVFDASRKKETVADLQLVAWILGECRTVDEVKEAVSRVQVAGIDPSASTVHWRFADPSGRQVVLEFVGGQARFYDNALGVLTNSPGFEWQMTNLNNYVNLFPGNVREQWLNDSLALRQFGAGAGFLGLPGDVTPPSRFVRAAFYQVTAPRRQTALETVLQSFQILNSFDIPIGIEFAKGEQPADIPSATQWTSAADIRNRILYYRTMYDSAIRSIDLKEIDFSRVKYCAVPLDKTKQQPVVPIKAGHC